ncbi:MAG: hypothetical protein JWN34_258 [Bryobacterales bacterium]|jgi:uncharacterized protein (TIGR00251 family)|nr:hypothetical protein [Bryobacterales bacterium]
MKTRLSLKVNAGARRTEFAGMHGDAWKLRIAAPPVDGKANAAIVKFLAQVAGVRASAVSIVSGETASTKIVEIDGIEAEALTRAILNSHGNQSGNG